MSSSSKEMILITQAFNSTALPFLLDSVTGAKSECRESTVRADKLLQGASRAPHTRVEVQSVEEEAFQNVLRKVHAPEYLDFLRQKSDELKEGESIMSHPFLPEGIDNDTPIVSGIFSQALESARTAYCAAGQILHGYQLAYGICRPPGHHAGKGFLGGYCYLNNAAVAAHTLKDGGKKKVAVLDIDFHFGNGTADLLVDQPDMFFCSIHCSTDIDYPYVPTCERNAEELYLAFTQKPDEKEYLEAVDKAIDAIRAFGAEVLVLSVGYDIIEEDPHGKWHLSDDIYLEIGKRLAELGLPICLIQEGGYAIEKLDSCAEKLCTGLLCGNTEG